MTNQLIKNNPNSAGAIFMSITAGILFFLGVSLFGFIALLIAGRYLGKASKAKENKKLIAATIVLMIIAVIFWLIAVAAFVIDQLETAQAI